MYDDVNNILVSIAKSEPSSPLRNLESNWGKYVQMLKGGQLEEALQEARKQRGVVEPLAVGLTVLLVSKLVDYIIELLSKKKRWKKAAQKLLKEEQIKYILDSKQTRIIYSHTVKYFDERMAMSTEGHSVELLAQKLSKEVDGNEQSH